MANNTTDLLTCDGTYCPNLTPTEDWQNLLLENLNYALNPIQLAFGFFVVIIYFAIRAHDKRLVNRISLRLQLAISILDILKAMEIILLEYIQTNQFGVVCGFTAFALVTFTNWYCLLNAMIAFNLHWVFLLGNPADSRFEKWYYIISFVFGIVPPAIVFIVGNFDWDPAQQYCWYKDSWTTRAHMSEIFSLAVWCLIPMLYSLIVVIAVVRKLYSSSRQISEAIKSTELQSRGKSVISDDIENKQRQTQRMVHKLITRIMLYPLIPLITQGPFFLSELWMICRLEISWAADLASVISTDIPGILNFIAFMVDPAFHNSLKSIRKDLIERYADGHVPASNTTSKTNDLAPYDAYTPSTGRSGKTMSPVMRWFVRVFLRPNRHDMSGGSAFYRMSSRPHSTPADSAVTCTGQPRRKNEARSTTSTSVTPSVSAIVDVENDSDDDDLGDGLPHWGTGYEARVSAYESMTQNL